MLGEKPLHAADYRWSMRVRVNAHLDPWLADVFSPLVLRHEAEGTSLLTGHLVDLAAVYGLLLALRDTAMPLVSLVIEREGNREKDYNA